MKGNGIIAAMLAIAGILIAANRLDQQFVTWFEAQIKPLPAQVQPWSGGGSGGGHGGGGGSGGFD